MLCESSATCATVTLAFDTQYYKEEEGCRKL